MLSTLRASVLNNLNQIQVDNIQAPDGGSVLVDASAEYVARTLGTPGAPVVVNLSDPPRKGQALTSTSTTNATWQNSVALANGPTYLTQINESANLPNSRRLIPVGGIFATFPGNDFILTVSSSAITPGTYSYPAMTVDNRGYVIVVEDGLTVGPNIVVVDNITDLQNAISGAGAPGVCILLLPGTYDITAPILISNMTNITVMGCGSLTNLHLVSGVVVMSIVNSTNISILNLQIDGSDSLVNNNLISVSGSTRAVFQGLTLYPTNLNNSVALNISNSPGDMVVINSKFLSRSGAGIVGIALGVIGPVGQVLIKDNLVQNLVQETIRVSSPSVQNLMIVGNQFINCGTIGVGQDNTVIANNVIEGQIQSTSTVDNVVIKGNVITTSSSVIPAIDMTDDVDTCIISNNIINSLSTNEAIRLLANGANIVKNRFICPNSTTSLVVYELGSGQTPLFDDNSLAGSSGTAEPFEDVAIFSAEVVNTQNGNIRSINTSGSITISGQFDAYHIFNTSFNQALMVDLDDLSPNSAGKRVFIKAGGHVQNSVNIRLTPANFADGSYLTFSLNGSTAMLTWNGAQWTTFGTLGLSFSGVVITP